jgi:hypothetical protein
VAVVLRLAYSATSRQAQALSGLLGYQRGPWGLSAVYTRITRAGRLLRSARVGP